MQHLAEQSHAKQYTGLCYFDVGAGTSEDGVLAKGRGKPCFKKLRFANHVFQRDSETCYAKRDNDFCDEPSGNGLQGRVL